MRETATCAVLVASCPAYRPIQCIWRACQQAFWPDCPFSITMVSPERDDGWNVNLLNALETVETPFILFLQEDHFLEEVPSGQYTNNMQAVVSLMETYEDIGLVKVQIGNAAPPEIPFAHWDRLGEYDRMPHPFKRTNLVPTMFRKTFLQRLCKAVLPYCNDSGRSGALAFEQIGTALTMDASQWPEKLLAIDRDNGQQVLLGSMANDGVREGKLQLPPRERDILDRIGVKFSEIPGIERFL